MAGAAALKKLLISAHGDAERVDHLVPQALRTLQNVLVHAIEVLYTILKNADRMYGLTVLLIRLIFLTNKSLRTTAAFVIK